MENGPADAAVAADERRIQRDRQARIVAGIVLASLAFVLLAGDTVTDASAGSQSKASPTPAPSITTIAKRIFGAGGGFLYPPRALAVHAAMEGRWNGTPGAHSELVYPRHVGEGLTVKYLFQGGEPVATSPGFSSLAGGRASLKVRSRPVAEAATLQEALGELVMEQADGRPALVLELRGHYFSDLGLLLAVGTTEPPDKPHQRIGTALIDFSASATASALPLPSRAPLPAERRMLPTVAEKDDITHTDRRRDQAVTLSNTFSASAAASPVLTTSATMSPTSSITTSPTMSQTSTKGISDDSMCVWAVALRFRPVGYSEAAAREAAEINGGTTHRTLSSEGANVVSDRNFKPRTALRNASVSPKVLASPGRYDGESLHGFVATVARLRSFAGAVHEAIFMPSAPTAHFDETTEDTMARYSASLVDLDNAQRHRANYAASRVLSSDAVAFGGGTIERDDDTQRGTSKDSLARRVATAFTHSPAYSGSRYVPLYGNAVSWNCNSTVNLTVATAVIDESLLLEKATTYSFVVTSTGLTLVTVLLMQIVRSSSQSAASRLSMLTIGMQALLDAATCIVHFIGGMMEPSLFLSLTVSVFVYMLLFSLLELRFLLMIYKAQRPERFTDGFESVRRAVVYVYIRFYAVLLLAGFIALDAPAWMRRAMLFCALSYWVPQIVRSVAEDSRPGLRTAYVVGTSLSRLALPLYFLLCPNNLAAFLVPPEPVGVSIAWGEAASSNGVDQAPLSWIAAPWMISPLSPSFVSPSAAALYYSNTRFALLLILWTTVQAVVVYLQGKSGWGARFFVPYVFLPPQYDYHRRIVVRGRRVVPDPAATAAWVRGSSPSPTPTRVTQAAGATPAPLSTADRVTAVGEQHSQTSILVYTTTLIRESVSSTVASARRVINASIWFADGIRVLLADAFGRAKSAIVGAGAGGSGSGNGGLGGAARGYAPIGSSGDDTGGGIDHASGEETDGETARAAGLGAGGASTSAAPASDSAIDCSVCLSEVSFPAQRRSYMVTPCDHVFHTACLTQWLEEQLVCPVCRSPLPEVLSATPATRAAGPPTSSTATGAAPSAIQPVEA